MSTNLDIKLELIQSNSQSDGRVCLYLSVISLLQMLKNFDQSLSIDIVCLYAEKIVDDSKYYDHAFLVGVNTVLGLTLKLEQYSDYVIIDSELIVNKNINLSCHDDGEVALTFNLS